MRRIIGCAVALWVGLAGMSAAGETHPVVVELFTSQGCSSCPPADEMLRELAQRDDVIALALHVDYWDYIGWKDIFGDPAFSSRQKAYARVAGARTVYTPQMVVAGSEHVVGYRPMEVAELIQAHRAATSPVSLTLERTGDDLVVSARAESTLEGATLVLQLVRYIPEQTVIIKRGENAGRTITYANIVTEWSPVAEWDGRTPFRKRFSLNGDAPVVAILQEQGPGRILAAARLR